MILLNTDNNFHHFRQPDTPPSVSFIFFLEKIKKRPIFVFIYFENQ